MEIDKEKKVEKPSQTWLQRLKNESWEAELLVSAVAIFGTFQLFELIDWWTNKFIDVLRPTQYYIGYIIVFFGLLAISILSSMFVIHFVLRAYWIGLVGLNSVFPDYSIKDSPYSKIYTEKIVSILPKLEDSIKKVDDLCSVIFSAAFTLLFMYLYMALLASLYLMIFNLLSDYVPAIFLLIPVLFVALMLCVQMILSIFSNLKSNKEKKNLQIWSFTVVRIVSLIIYGPLYKSILQVSMIFGSNFKKKKGMIYLVLSFLLFGLITSIYQITTNNVLYLINQEPYFDQTRTYASFYKTENKDNTFLLTPEIDADQINTNVLKLFIPIFDHERNLRKEKCASIFEENKGSKSQQFLECYHSYHVLSLNNKKISVEYLKYDHPRTRQFGVVTYIDLSELKRGMNNIKIEKEYSLENSIIWTIPFYFNKNSNF